MKHPETIHGYRVIKHIGSGAASEIYCVFDPKTSQVYALKQVEIANMNRAEREEAVDEVRERVPASEP